MGDHAVAGAVLDVDAGCAGVVAARGVFHESERAAFGIDLAFVDAQVFGNRGRTFLAVVGFDVVNFCVCPDARGGHWRVCRVGWCADVCMVGSGRKPSGGCLDAVRVEVDYIIYVMRQRADTQNL